MRNAEQNIFPVLFAHIFHIEVHVGQIDAFVIADFAAVYYQSFYVSVCSFFYFNDDLSIID